MDSASLSYTDPEVPEVDLGFAISVTPGVAQQKLKLVKEAVYEMIDRYGVGRAVHYGFMVFDSLAVIKIPFTSEITDIADLKKAVNGAIISASGSSDLVAALEKAEMLFNGSKRSQAKKVLVVIVDGKSVSEPDIVEVGYMIFLKTL